MSSDLTIAVYCTVIPCVIAFGLYAIYQAYSEQKTEKNKTKDVAYFISAQGSQPLHRVTFSLISTTLGAWVIFAPSGYSLTSGYLLSGGIPLIVPAFFGPLVQKYGGALSLNDFVKKRFGRIAEYFVMMLVLYNMANGIAGEYTAVGDLFEKIAGGSRLLIVILLSTVTCIYTAYGGLSVSVKTDQVQTISVIIMVIIFSFYVAAVFRLDTSKPLPPYLDNNEFGQAAFCTSIFSFFGWVVYSEAFWQKAWVAKELRWLLLYFCSDFSVI
jgi:Na+/proline symporter